MDREIMVVDPGDTDRSQSLAATVSGQAMQRLSASDVGAQLDAAHAYPRSIQRFLARATEMATHNEDIAAACIYSLPRAGKQITGPSVRLAEICASAYGNLQVGARIVGESDSFITAQGIAWDMETNLKVTMEVQRRITKKNGDRYDDDMIGVAGAAASSIALRNAIFRVVPRTYIEQVYERARRVSVGDDRTLVEKRGKCLTRLGVLGVTQERVLARLGVKGIEDIGLEGLETLIGLGTAIKDGSTTIDEAFPPVVAAMAGDAPEGRRIRLGDKKNGEAAPKAEERTFTEERGALPDGTPTVTTSFLSDQQKAAQAETQAQAREDARQVAQATKPEGEKPKFAADHHLDWPVPACPDCNTAEHVIRAHRASKLGHLVCDNENGHAGCGRRFWRASDSEIEAVKASVMALDEDTLATVTVAMQAERVPTNMQAWAFEHAETARAILADEAKKRAARLPATGGMPGSLE